MFSTVHIYFGDSSGPKYDRRIEEIDTMAEFLAKRAEKDDVNHILVGDFNIKKPGSPGHNALKKHGFEIYQNNTGSNKDQTKFYDQISFRVRKKQLRFADSDRNMGVFQFFDSLYREEDFDQYEADLKKTVEKKIGRLEEEIEEKELKLTETASESKKEKLRKSIEKRKDAILDWKAHLLDEEKLKKYYLKEWRTFHGSDHLPLWVELAIDFSGDYLEYLETLY